MKPFTVVRKLRDGRTGGVVIIPEKVSWEDIKGDIANFSTEIVKQTARSIHDIVIIGESIEMFIEEEVEENPAPLLICVLVDNLNPDSPDTPIVKTSTIKLSKLIGTIPVSVEMLIRGFSCSISDEFLLSLEAGEEEKPFIIPTLLSAVALLGDMLENRLQELSPRLQGYGIHKFGNPYYITNTTVGKILGLFLSHDQTDEEAEEILREVLTESGMAKPKALEYVVPALCSVLKVNREVSKLKNKKMDLLFLIHETALEVNNHPQKYAIGYPINADSDSTEKFLRGRGFNVENYILMRSYLTFIDIAEDYRKDLPELMKEGEE